ncbi:phage tail tape measure protein [Eisenbergiella tayi]|nr:phage tail tape measure protein [Eisenbergiella tayi]
MAIKIAGEIEKSFYNSTKLTKKELQGIAKTAAQTSGAVPKTFSQGLKDAEPAFTGLENVAKKSFKAITAAAVTGGATIAAGLAASVSAGSEFESAFAGVKKTVNATAPELAQMRDEIREMSKEMPTSAAGLSEIAESAGQLGIQTENITKFTKTMADLSVATNLTSEKGAAEFAKFANITKMPQENFDRLGSSVVALGNNMATTEADIVGMGMRIAAAGDQVNLSQADIMAYAASLSSVGIEAEAGGSAFSKLLVNLQMATETGKGLSEYAKVAGMTGKEFKQAFQEDATTAINSFLSGLNDTERNGKSAIAVLDDMGLTEVRLRDTLLRAANASEMFEGALETSNTAWEENTALAKEAEQRYSTFESQCDILGNKITDIGISVYDSLKPGLTEAMGLANDFVDSLAGQEDAIGGFIDSAVKKMPTMVRQVKDAGKAIGDFAKPFLQVGGWLADNPGLLVGTIVGIGSALTAYKVASGVMSLATSLGALGPVGMGILALGGVAAVIAGIGTAVKKSANEAKKANLNKHFGNISLSMKDLQEVASSIVKGKNLEQITESITAMGELDGIAEDIQSAADALNKMNWKVSIGLELTETEEEEYRSQAEEYIRATQEYLEQKQFALNLSIGALSDGDLENNDLVDKVNRFYEGKKQELAALGTQLNDAITEAFQDGLLDIDEAAEIAKIQQSMAEIQSAMAGSEYQAGLDLIGMKYGGQQLDADSFQNLQAEIQGQVDAASGKYAEAYTANVSQYGVMLEEGGPNGFSQEEYDEAVKEAKAEYLKQVAELQQQAVDFQIQMIQQAYPELGDIQKELESAVSQQTESAFKGATESGEYGKYIPFIGDDITDQMKGKVDKATQDALGELFEKLQPSVEQLEGTKTQAIEMGAAIPEGVNEGIRDANAIGVLSGNTEALWDLIGQETESDEYNGMIKAMQEAGAMIPEEFANAVKMNQGVVQDAVTDMYGIAENAVNSAGGSGRTGKKSTSGRKGRNPLIGHAEGGIFDTPHIAWFAENGPESAIPLDGSKNAISLWLRTGELLGMDGLTGGTEPITAGVGQMAASSGGGPQFVFSPRLNFYGDAPAKEEITELIETEQEKFERNMQQWIKQNGRLSFV